MKQSVLIELHHAQNKMNFSENEKFIDALSILLPEIIVIDIFLVLTHEVNSISKNIFFHINLYHYHAQDLHLEDS